MDDLEITEAKEFFLEIIKVAPEPHSIAKRLAQLTILIESADSEAAMDSLFMSLRNTYRRGNVEINETITKILEDEESNFN
jgi:hypothetical protein